MSRRHFLQQQRSNRRAAQQLGAHVAQLVRERRERDTAAPAPAPATAAPPAVAGPAGAVSTPAPPAGGGTAIGDDAA
jgi:hypothetical protein